MQFKRVKIFLHYGFQLSCWTRFTRQPWWTRFTRYPCARFSCVLCSLFGLGRSALARDSGCRGQKAITSRISLCVSENITSRFVIYSDISNLQRNETSRSLNQENKQTIDLCFKHVLIVYNIQTLVSTALMVTIFRTRSSGIGGYRTN